METQKALKKLKKRLKKTSFVEDKYRQEGWLMDNRFGKIMIWSKKNGQDLVIMKSRIHTSIENCLKDAHQVTERQKINNEYLMKMLDFSLKVIGLTHFEIWGFYQAPLKDLKKEISLRVDNQR